MTQTFMQAYQDARAIADRLKIGARSTSVETVISALSEGKPVIVLKRIKSGGVVYVPGAEFVSDPMLLERHIVYARLRYFTTVEQSQVSQEWATNKRIHESLEGVQRNWMDASTKHQQNLSKVATAKADLQRAEGELAESAARLKQAEAEGMEVFAGMKKN